MKGWQALPSARSRSSHGSSRGHVDSDGACHILAHGDATAWLCDEDTTCVETQHMVLCTEPSPDMKCVLQEGLAIDGKPVWACAPISESSESPTTAYRSQLHMSLVRRGGESLPPWLPT
eukprot:CAMPEP_0119069722 /NCGR_PEP_ID=MMETSP1178-20130426/28287_1 /TAXON_ID=33656 /ORGANISM="unid sp, Strain CCMP2000" /LENGTH=118 /DNA_ID=CAMNT_0007051515 /DNA_START=61 /DNA_END=417 /DNA_ORIENTATION=+